MPRALFVFSSKFLSSLLNIKPLKTFIFLARKMPAKIIRMPIKKTPRL